MKIKTSELACTNLDWAVEKANGTHWSPNGYWVGPDTPYTFNTETPAYSDDYAQGGPIIYQAGISTVLRYSGQGPDPQGETWDAIIKPHFFSNGRHDSGVKKEVIMSGPTPLIAAMRCYVASKLGDEVEVP